MFNEAFKSDYVTAYFNYVLDSTGELQYANRNSQRMTPENSAQIMIEQWFIAALVEYWRRIGGREITTKSYSRVISCDDYFMPYDPDLPASSIRCRVGLPSTICGARRNTRMTGRILFSKKARSTLIGATRIVENSPYRDVLKVPFGALISGTALVIRIGTRGSLLATTQAGTIRDALIARGHAAELVIISTEGDRSDRPVAEIRVGVFTAALREAIADGRVDLGRALVQGSADGTRCAFRDRRGAAAGGPSGRVGSSGWTGAR